MYAHVQISLIYNLMISARKTTHNSFLDETFGEHHTWSAFLFTIVYMWAYSSSIIVLSLLDRMTISMFCLWYRKLLEAMINVVIRLSRNLTLLRGWPDQMVMFCSPSRSARTLLMLSDDYRRYNKLDDIQTRGFTVGWRIHG